MLEKTLESASPSAFPVRYTTKCARQRTFIGPVIAEFFEARALLAVKEDDESNSVVLGSVDHDCSFKRSEFNSSGRFVR